MIGGPFSHHRDEDAQTVVLQGELGEGADEQIRALVDLEVGNGPNLIFDLTQLSFIWSNAVGELVRAQQAVRAAGGSLTLVAGEGSIAARVLSICGVPYESPSPPSGGAVQV